MLSPSATLTAEEIARLRAFDLLDAIADFVSICVVVGLWSFLAPRPEGSTDIYGLVAVMGIASLGWHALVPIKLVGPPKLVVNNLLSAVFASFIIGATGYEQSPFFFLYYLVLLRAALETGVLGALVTTVVVAVMYAIIVITQPQAGQHQLVHSISLWSNLASVCVVGWIGALSAHEAEKVRKDIEQARDRIEAFAKIDWLTGVYNRRHYDALASSEMSRAERYRRPLSLLIVDSDHLKAVNDRLGHQVGDQLLIELAAIITQQCRVSDTVIRYGGDEFVVLLPETDQAGAGFLGDRIRASVEEYAITVEDGQELRTTVSVGVASYPENADDAWSLLNRADSALYRSKESGRNRTTIYSRDMPPPAPDGDRSPGRAPEAVLRPPPATPEGELHTA